MTCLHKQKIYLILSLFILGSWASAADSEKPQPTKVPSDNYSFFMKFNKSSKAHSKFIKQLWNSKLTKQRPRSRRDSYWSTLRQIVFTPKTDPNLRISLVNGPLRKLYYGLEALEEAKIFRKKIASFGSVYNKVGTVTKPSVYEKTGQLEYLLDLDDSRELFEELVRLVQTGLEEQLLLDNEKSNLITKAYRRLYQVDSDMGQLLFEYRKLRREIQYAIPLLKLIEVAENALAQEWISTYHDRNVDIPLVQKAVDDYRQKNKSRSPAKKASFKLLKSKDIPESRKQTLRLYSNLIERLKSPEMVLNQFRT